MVNELPSSLSLAFIAKVRAQRAVENELARWETFQFSDPGQADHINAEIHVAHAEIYQFADEVRKAKREIDEARAALETSRAKYRIGKDQN